MHAPASQICGSGQSTSFAQAGVVQRPARQTRPARHWASEVHALPCGAALGPLAGAGAPVALGAGVLGASRSCSGETRMLDR